MKLKKLIPWNWFKHEDESNAQPAALERSRGSGTPAMHHSEMDRLMGGFFEHPWSAWPSLGATFNRLTSSNDLLKPTMDISESNHAYTLKLEVPGVEKEDVSIEIEDGRLTVSGEKRHELEEEEDEYHRIERSYGMFRRVLDLPPDADETRIDAKFKNGVLILKVAKDNSKKKNARVIDVS